LPTLTALFSSWIANAMPSALISSIMDGLTQMKRLQSLSIDMDVDTWIDESFQLGRFPPLRELEVKLDFETLSYLACALPSPDVILASFGAFLSKCTPKLKKLSFHCTNPTLKPRITMETLCFPSDGPSLQLECLEVKGWELRAESCIHLKTLKSLRVIGTYNSRQPSDVSWRALMDARIRPQIISIIFIPVDRAVVDFLASYSGLTRLNVVTAIIWVYGECFAYACMHFDNP
jgi:hypothetical protein